MIYSYICKSTDKKTAAGFFSRQLPLYVNYFKV